MDLMQSRLVQVTIKFFRIIPLTNSLLRFLNMTRSVGKTDLKYRLRYADTLLLAKGLFSGDDEYSALKEDATEIHRFIDLGCNVGLFPIYLCFLRGDRQIAGILIDANPNMVEEARHNLTLNNLHDVAAFLGIAGGDPPGATRNFWLAQNSTSSTANPELLGTRMGIKKIQVPVIDPLALFESKWGQTTRIDLLKIDIEGVELEFLQANETLLSRCDRVILEFHKPKVTLDAVVSFFIPRGFKLNFSRDRETVPLGIAYFTRPLLASPT